MLAYSTIGVHLNRRQARRLFAVVQSHVDISKLSSVCVWPNVVVSIKS